MTSFELGTLELPPNCLELNSGATDPIYYYVRPVVGRIFRARLELGLKLLADRKQLGDVLEIGYGNGVVLYNLQPHSTSLTGIDLDADPTRMTALLGARGVTATLSRGDARKMDYPDGSFDTVVAFSIFEHVVDFKAILAECYRVLRPGGRLLIGMPSVNKMMEVAFFAIGFRGIADHHVTTPREVRRGIFQQQGLELVRYETLPPLAPVKLYHCMLAERR